MNDKGAIIKLKQKGHSNRSIQRLTGTNRKTVAKYWSEHCECHKLLAQGGTEHDLRELQERISGKPKYKTGLRPPRQYTSAVEASLFPNCNNKKSSLKKNWIVRQAENAGRSKKFL